MLALGYLMFASMPPALVGQEQSSAPEERPAPELVDQGRSKFKELLAIEGLSLKKYKNIVPVSAGISFKDVRPGIYPGQTEYELSPQEREQLERAFGGLFVRELMNWERFPLVEKPEPESIYMKVSMSDVVSYVPPPDVRQQHEINRILSGTLGIELFDSQTGHMIMKIADPFLIRELQGIRHNEFLWSIDSTQSRFKRWGADTKALLKKYDK